MISSGILAALSMAAPAAAAPADRLFLAALKGASVRILQPGDFKELKRGTVVAADLPERCVLRLTLQGDSRPKPSLCAICTSSRATVSASISPPAPALRVSTSSTSVKRATPKPCAG